MTAKPWYQSITLWLNILAVLVLVLGIVLDNALALNIPSQWVVYLSTALAIANALLRVFRTSQPVSIRGNTPSLK